MTTRTSSAGRRPPSSSSRTRSSESSSSGSPRRRHSTHSTVAASPAARGRSSSPPSSHASSALPRTPSSSVARGARAPETILTGPVAVGRAASRGGSSVTPRSELPQQRRVSNFAPAPPPPPPAPPAPPAVGAYGPAAPAMAPARPTPASGLHRAPSGSGSVAAPGVFPYHPQPDPNLCNQPPISGYGSFTNGNAFGSLTRVDSAGPGMMPTYGSFGPGGLVRNGSNLSTNGYGFGSGYAPFGSCAPGSMCGPMMPMSSMGIMPMPMPMPMMLVPMSSLYGVNSFLGGGFGSLYGMGGTHAAPSLYGGMHMAGPSMGRIGSLCDFAYPPSLYGIPTTMSRPLSRTGSGGSRAENSFIVNEAAASPKRPTRKRGVDGISLETSSGSNSGNNVNAPPPAKADATTPGTRAAAAVAAAAPAAANENGGAGGKNDAPTQVRGLICVVAANPPPCAPTPEPGQLEIVVSASSAIKTAVKGAVLKKLRDEWLHGHTAALLTCSDSERRGHTLVLASTFVAECFAKLKETTSYHNISVAIVALRDGASVLDLLKTGASYAPLQKAISPMLGPMLDKVTQKEAKDSAAFGGLLKTAVSHTKSSKDMIICMCVLKQLRKTRGDAEQLVVSVLNITFVANNLHYLKALRESDAAAAPVHLYRYAVAGACHTVCAACVDDKDETAKAPILEVQAMHAIVNRTPRSGSVSRFVDFAAGEVAKLEKAEKKTQDEATARQRKQIQQMYADAKTLLKHPKTEAPKAYPALK